MNDLIKKLEGYRQSNVAQIQLNVYKKEESQEIVDAIKKVFPNIEVVIAVDQSLLGGYTVRIDDILIDNSYALKLQQFQKYIENIELKNDSNIVKGIQDSMSNFHSESSEQEIGIIESVKDGICKIKGLGHCMYQELLLFPNGVKGLAFNLEKGFIGAIILGDFSKIKSGDIVKRSQKVIAVPVSENLLGRVIDPLGVLLDDGPKLLYDQYYPVEKVAPGVMSRKPVNVPLQTGIKAIDTLIPIGRGQRELILGDRQTGKTTIAIDTIINQKTTGVICIYVAIGQKESKVAKLVEKLKKLGAMDYTIVVNASASDPSPMLYIAPYSGTAIGEFFMDQGKDVLIIYDDLSKHAIAYREMSLLLRRPPGREAFPGDVFYLHSRLLERACRLKEKHGGGSLTALPIIETQAGDISAYIPTNVISITDGQIFLETDLFYKGVRPAINVGLSVSRVGGDAQIRPMKKAAGSLKIALAQFRELEVFSQFSSDLDINTKKQIARGKRITEMLKQKPFSPLKVADQIVAIYAVNNGYLDEFELSDLAKIESELLQYFNNSFFELVQELQNGKWDEVIENKLKSACQSFVEDYQRNVK